MKFGKIQCYQYTDSQKLELFKDPGSNLLRSEIRLFQHQHLDNKNLPNTSVQDYFISLKINLRDILKEAKKDKYTYTYTYANIMQDIFFFKIFSKKNHHIF